MSSVFSVGDTTLADTVWATALSTRGALAELQVHMYMCKCTCTCTCTCMYACMDQGMCASWKLHKHTQVQHIRSNIKNCEGWLSPGGHSSGGRALTAKVRGPRFNPEWLPVFHSSLNVFPSLSSCMCKFCTCTVHDTK